MRRPTVLLLGMLALPAVLAAAPVRFFVVGHKQRLDDAVTYQTYHDKMAALMDATFPGRGSLVQADVDDVASHLLPADPGAPANALVLFPEDVGLIAVFIGTRGGSARGQTTAVGAIATLLGTYAPQYAYYNTKFPGQPAVRVLGMALTDTVYRSFYETFRELAMTHGVYLSASGNLAPARRVEVAMEPTLAALLRDPDEPARSYAYEAVSPAVGNSTFVFAPNGEVIVADGRGGTVQSPSETQGTIRPSNQKPYLVEIEEPPPGTATGLALAFGAVRDQEVLPTPVGRLAIVTSKPAWMIDVNERYAAKGANVVLQPEAFSEWAYAASPWQPDVFREGGFANLQQCPSFVANLNASMTGNLLDVTFDGQSAVLGRRRKTSPGPLGPGNVWVGQNPDTGFLAVAPWIEPDPGIASPALGLAARRDMLASDGAHLLPGSGVPCIGPLVAGACDDGYREAVVWADVDVPEGIVTAAVDTTRAAPPHFSASMRVVSDDGAFARHAPQVAAAGRDVYVVWHETGGSLENVYLAVSHDGGRRFAPPVHVSANPPASVPELHPAVAVRGRRVVVAWQELAANHDDDRGRVMLARFDRQGHKHGTDERVDDTDQSGKWLPAVALTGSVTLVAWVDERDTGPEGEPLEHIYAARSQGTGHFEPATRVDAGQPVPLAAHTDNKWAPALAVGGRSIYVAWTDFRNYNWDIFLARSDDRGRHFGANVRVDDFPDLERIDGHPTLAADRRGRVHLAWADLRAREPDTNIFYARSTDQGQSFSPNRQLDDSRVGFDLDHDVPSNQWHPSLAADAGRLFAAWQDDRLGNNDIFFTTSTDGGTTFAAAERVDDTGDGGSEQSRPNLALTSRGRRRTCYVVWEDDRSGTADIYLARRRCGS